MPLLLVEDLSISFRTHQGPFTAVRDLSFSLEVAESLAIVGESGSGKSVSTRAIMGLLDPGSIEAIKGHIQFANRDWVQAEEADFQTIRGSRIAMIFQEPMTALNPVMRCGEQVAESVALHQKSGKKERKKKVLDLFEEVLLPTPDRIYRSYPHELSGGQRQRVMIAMALAGDPEILIADEPTTALDVSVQAAILALLNKLRSDREMALIFISHDLGVVRQVADKTLVMYKGMKVEEGPTKELFAQPKHIYTRALLQCRPGANQVGYRLPVLSDFYRVDAQGNWVEKERSSEKLEWVPSFSGSAEPLIEVKGVRVKYTKQENWGRRSQLAVIHDLNFTIREGETLSLLGESGSGKSTLGRAIMQLIRYDGEVSYRGKSLENTNDRKELSRKMQLIYQDPYSSLNPKFRIRQVFDEILHVHGLGKSAQERKTLSIRMMERVGMTESDLNKYPHEFSGGQRQRISIARALILDPEFVVCDESVSALDVSVQAQVLNLMKDLQAEMGLTYLFITHDLHVARYIADRVMVLDKGHIAEMGETDKIFEHPQNDYTRKLLSAQQEV